MDLKRLIQEDYQESIRLMDIPEGLRKALRAHERTPKFLDNLLFEISKLPPKLQPDRIGIKKIVYDLTNLFALNVKRKFDEESMSKVAQDAMKAKAQELKDLDSTVSGKSAGIYEELEIHAVDRNGGTNGQDQSAKKKQRGKTFQD